jgi:hypothetical protein
MQPDYNSFENEIHFSNFFAHCAQMIFLKFSAHFTCLADRLSTRLFLLFPSTLKESYMFINPTKETLELTRHSLANGKSSLHKEVTISTGLT